MTLVWDNFSRGGSEKLAMLALADWCNDEGESLHPSIGAIAKKINVSDKQARRIIHKFIDEGYLLVVANHYGGDPGQSRHYKLNVGLLKSDTPPTDGSSTPPAGVTPPTYDHSHGCPSTPPTDGSRPLPLVSLTPPTGGSQTTMNHHITTNEPPLEKKSESPDFLFDVTEQTKSDFKKLRLAKKAPITERAITAIRKEAERAGIDLETALIECCARGWAGFKAEWYMKSQSPPARASPDGGKKFKKFSAFDYTHGGDGYGNKQEQFDDNGRTIEGHLVNDISKI